MKYLHSMIRVTDLERSLRFYKDALGFQVVRKDDYPKDKFTLVFLRAPGDKEEGALLELTYNYDQHSYEKGDAFGHLAYLVDSIEAFKSQVEAKGYSLSWGPGATPNGKSLMAFIDDPDGYEIELIERKG